MYHRLSLFHKVILAVTLTTFLLLLIFYFISSKQDQSEYIDVDNRFSNEIAECPGIEYVVEAFEFFLEEYPEMNPEATSEEREEIWNGYIESINCEEFTSDNFKNTYNQFMVNNASSTEYDYYSCPNEEIFERFWNSWSSEYLVNNPVVDIDTQMLDWNKLMLTNECDVEWLNPLDGLIEQYTASSTIQDN